MLKVFGAVGVWPRGAYSFFSGRALVAARPARLVLIAALTVFAIAH